MIWQASELQALRDLRRQYAERDWWDRRLHEPRFNLEGELLAHPTTLDEAMADANAYARKWLL